MQISLKSYILLQIISLNEVKMAYPFDTIEPKWQKYWDEHKTFKTVEDSSVPKEKRAYVLDMFPYPSAQGLHVGHPEGYTATDIYCRYLRMNGYNVLHPMGYDAFGLPAENYAIKTGTHPKTTTNANIAHFTKQIKALGFSYDWDRCIETCTPDYYKWIPSVGKKRTGVRKQHADKLVSELQNGACQRRSQRRQVRPLRLCGNA